jgi:hypothetical protein
MGGGLYLHNWLHAKSESTVPLSPGKNIVSYSCNCIDDFSMPFTECDEKIANIIVAPAFQHNISLQSFIPFSSTFFFSLRAPPALS